MLHNKLIAVPPVSNKKILIIGGGCGGIFAALRIKQTGLGDVHILTKSLFGIHDCTVKVSQLHISGLEYINDIDSAKALITGGVEFISIFGKKGWESLVQLGILEKNGTRFQFTQETLLQEKPSPEIVRKNLPKLEAFYTTLKERYNTLILPEKLFSTISSENPNNQYENIVINTIQPGIAIMRLGALLKNLLCKYDIPVIHTDFFKTSIQKTDKNWIIDSNKYDIIINATNGVYKSINLYIKEQTVSESLIPSHRDTVKNHRYQLYLEGTAFKTSEQPFATPNYTLCTTNTGENGKKFLGCMLDRTGIIQNQSTGDLSTCYILYAAGPNHQNNNGGGSWGNTDNSSDEIIISKITHSVVEQFPELKEVKLRPLFLHNGYNINVQDAQSRSDIRPFMSPEINENLPLLITQFCLKFTHSAFTSKQTVHTLIDQLVQSGDLSVTQANLFHEKNTSFEIELDLTENQLTNDTLNFCKEAQVPNDLAQYLSASKQNWST